MSKKINVNPKNSKMINGKLFITGLKYAQLSPSLGEFIVDGSTIEHPTLGKMYQYDGPFSRGVKATPDTNKGQASGGTEG